MDKRKSARESEENEKCGTLAQVANASRSPFWSGTEGYRIGSHQLVGMTARVVRLAAPKGRLLLLRPCIDQGAVDHKDQSKHHTQYAPTGGEEGRTR